MIYPIYTKPSISHIGLSCQTNYLKTQLITKIKITNGYLHLYYLEFTRLSKTHGLSMRNMYCHTHPLIQTLKLSYIHSHNQVRIFIVGSSITMVEQVGKSPIITVGIILVKSRFLRCNSFRCYLQTIILNFPLPNQATTC